MIVFDLQTIMVYLLNESALISMTEEIYTSKEISLLSNCTLCLRECGVNRFDGGNGYCGADAGMNIALICIHRGEEPPISGPSGICNIFFSGCNLRCIYCQNHDISHPGGGGIQNIIDLDEALDNIENIVSDDIKAVGFVSPSHVVPQVKAIIRGLHSRGLRPVTVYNTNSYEKPEVIDSLEGLIDVYLPDYKYASPSLAAELSDATDYPDAAMKVLKRMYYQKGSTLHLDKEGRVESGILIRHLVLPGYVEESKALLGNIAREISTGVHLSLMSQYCPTSYVNAHSGLNRILYRPEYEAVVETMEKLGFRNGWLQDIDSYRNYRPDFSREHPFE
jgi:putative pyruvate formate lyase activating enzyme